MQPAADSEGQEAERWAVVVLNWNGTDATLDCIESVEAAGRNCRTVTLSGILVDNGSEPESLTALHAAVNAREHWELLRLEKNLGFSRGMNAGIRAARRRGASHVLLLNNDTILDSNAISALAACQAQRPSELVGLAINPRSSDDRDALTGYRYYSWLGAAWPVYRLPSDTGIAPTVDYICGSAMLCDMAFLQRINGIPEQSFLYFEELRLARALPPGTKPTCCHTAIARHSAGQSARRLTHPSRHYFAAHACYRYTLDYHALKLPVVTLARVARLAQISVRSRSTTPLREGLLALWDCLSGVERRPA